jgi:hypothetical protein
VVLLHESMADARRAVNKASGSRSHELSSSQGAQRMRMSKIEHGHYASSFEETLAPLGGDAGEVEHLRQYLLDYRMATLDHSQGGQTKNSEDKSHDVDENKEDVTWVSGESHDVTENKGPISREV